MGKGAVRSGKSWWAPRATWQKAGSKEFEEREILIFNIKVVSCESANANLSTVPLEDFTLLEFLWDSRSFISDYTEKHRKNRCENGIPGGKQGQGDIIPAEN